MAETQDPRIVRWFELQRLAVEATDEGARQMLLDAAHRLADEINS